MLPLSPHGLESLRPFGYELFLRPASSSSQLYGTPVPADYVLGPGDSLQVQLFGSRNAEYDLLIERDGSIQFPEIGPVQIGGMGFTEARQRISGIVSNKLIGAEVSVSMGELRMIQVFLVGDVNAPGAYPRARSFITMKWASSRAICRLIVASASSRRIGSSRFSSQRA